MKMILNRKLFWYIAPKPQVPYFTLPPGPPPGLTTSAPSSPTPPSSLSPMDEPQLIEADFDPPRPTLHEAYAVWKGNRDDMILQYRVDSAAEKEYRDVHGLSTHAWLDRGKQFDREQIQCLDDFAQLKADYA